MKKLFCIFLSAFIFCCLRSAGANDEISLYGRVKTAITNQDLIQAIVLLYDSQGNVTDSLRANKGFRLNENGKDTLSVFHISIPRTADTTIVFDVICEGFKPQTVAYTLSNLKKWETSRDMPVVFMQRAPIQLKEVSVTATKIKFYNKGDTIVYNADAFQMAEGSMLDALIAQLPGVELDTDGQIKVNGRFVESLLLDGKEFFDGQNNLMLENIAAYTVKDIQVYEGERKKDEKMGLDPNKVLTMDVRLKKEYNIGWNINMQGGYGTKNRYSGRAFISWFNPKWRVSMVGNVNNLNDNRQPGRNDTWTPDLLPVGTKEYRSAGLNYNFSTPDEKTEAEGNIMFRQNNDKVITASDNINFLQGGNTYERSFKNSKEKNTFIRTSHYIYQEINGFAVGANFEGNYSNEKNSNNSLGAAFDKDPGAMTRETLEAIYSDGSPEKLETILNRSNTRTDGYNSVWHVGILPYINYKIPFGGTLRASFNFIYNGQKPDKWKDYEINYGANPVPGEKLRQYFDNKPNMERSWTARLGYTREINKISLGLSYIFEHQNNIRTSYMYSLDRLNDMGIYGTLPSDYLLAFNAANSYKSHAIENRSTIHPWLNFFLDKGNRILQVMFQGDIMFVHRKFDYWRDNTDYRLSTSNTLISMPTMYNAMIFYCFGKHKNGSYTNWRNDMHYSYSIAPELPYMVDMIDIVDDTDPLNIYYGNPGLKPSIRNRHQVWWFYNPESYTFKNDFSVSYTYTLNDLVQGYTYDTSTGVRHNRMYNVGGNNTFAVSDNVNWQFGNRKQFTMTAGADIGFSKVSNMIGVNLEAPEQSSVRNNTVNEKFKLTWQLGKQNIGIKCNIVNRHSTSTQGIFKTLNATHVNAGIQGVFVLPAGFGISTDFTCYTRRGYGESYLDTTDPVWNLRLTYSPPRSNHWVMMLDGFDMLHQLSNINYAVNASGRTISYTNTLPRYILFSVQYRLNIQPKKR